MAIHLFSRTSFLLFISIIQSGVSHHVDEIVLHHQGGYPSKIDPQYNQVQSGENTIEILEYSSDNNQI